MKHLDQRNQPEQGVQRLRQLVAIGSVALILAACAVVPSVKGRNLYDPATRHRADQVVSSFENSTTDIQYGYTENIDDGRGITAGRAGFTTGTGDALEVVTDYNKLKPHNLLSPYIPSLQKVNGSDSTAGLDGFTTAWQRSAADPQFRRVQDSVVDELYFNPAMKWADRENIHSALGQLIIYDTIIQHGEGDDPDGLPAIVHETAQKYPRGNVSEADWLDDFLTVRKYHLEHAADPSTREDWKQSVDRVDALRGFINDKNMNLAPPLKWTVYGDSYSL